MKIAFNGSCTQFGHRGIALATISKRSSGWFAQVRRKGFEPEYRTFKKKADAEKWARERESRIDQGLQSASRRSLRNITFGDLIRRYIEEVTPTKRGAEPERLRLKKMLRAPLVDVTLVELSPSHFAAYRDVRSAQVKPATVTKELSLFHNVIEVARKEWDIGLTANVVTQVRRLPVHNHRDRRLRPGEKLALLKAIEESRNRLLRPAVCLAIETALRRGELLNLRWHDIALDRRVARIQHTKTGYARTIPLTDGAIAILQTVAKEGALVFPMTAMALRKAWNRARERAGLADLRFHDLRHEAISRFAEMGLSTVELATISGHRDPRMLFRYTHLSPERLAKQLAGRSWEAEQNT